MHALFVQRPENKTFDGLGLSGKGGGVAGICFVLTRAATVLCLADEGLVTGGFVFQTMYVRGS